MAGVQVVDGEVKQCQGEFYTIRPGRCGRDVLRADQGQKTPGRWPW